MPDPAPSAPPQVDLPAPAAQPTPTDLNVVFPGREVQFKNGAGAVLFKVQVLPLRYRHIKTFYKVVERIVGAVVVEFASIDRESLKTAVSAASAEIGPDGKVQEDGPASKALMKMIGGAIARTIPMLLIEIDPLLRACVSGVELDDLPHEAVPVILEQWIDESFSGDKIRPWLVAAEAIIQRMTGSKLDLTSLLSIASSVQGTALQTSTTTHSPSSTHS